MKIASIEAWQIYDSRGFPTVEAEVTLDNGIRGRGLAPSGASTGQFEAVELRDGDPKRFRGKSVFKAIANIQNEIAPALLGADVFEQAALDKKLIELDGTPNKSRLGANAILPVSMAVANAAAAARNQPLYAYLGREGTLLPVPEIQIIGGGAHANWRTDVQDFLLIATGARSFEEVMEITHNVYHAAGEILRERKKYFGIADEGGFWPEFARNEDALELLVEAIRRAGYTPGREASIALDIAASDLYDEETKPLPLQSGEAHVHRQRVLRLDGGVVRSLPHCFHRRPHGRYGLGRLARRSWRSWAKRIQIVGDDLFTTNEQRIRKGIENKVGQCRADQAEPDRHGDGNH